MKDDTQLCFSFMETCDPQQYQLPQQADVADSKQSSSED